MERLSTLYVHNRSRPKDLDRARGQARAHGLGPAENAVLTRSDGGDAAIQ
jgi:hypothetical protein